MAQINASTIETAEELVRLFEDSPLFLEHVDSDSLRRMSHEDGQLGITLPVAGKGMSIFCSSAVFREALALLDERKKRGPN